MLGKLSAVAAADTSPPSAHLSLWHSVRVPVSLLMVPQPLAARLPFPLALQLGRFPLARLLAHLSSLGPGSPPEKPTQGPPPFRGRLTRCPPPRRVPVSPLTGPSAPARGAVSPREPVAQQPVTANSGGVRSGAGCLCGLGSASPRAVQRLCWRPDTACGAAGAEASRPSPRLPVSPAVSRAVVTAGRCWGDARLELLWCPCLCPCPPPLSPSAFSRCSSLTRVCR